jgi:hypothetical protein
MKKNAGLSILLLGAAVMIMSIPIHPPVLL